MSLRNQPYIPLYVNDFMTDEKLCECSAESTGVYIRLMCLLHKSDEYGTFLLKQKYKQGQNICLSFASNLARFLPYDVSVIERSLQELLDNGVIEAVGDKLLQKRMVKDNLLSETRSKAGRAGGQKTFAQAKIQTSGEDFAQAKTEANTEYEYVNENQDEIKDKKEGKGRKIFSKPTLDEVTTYCLARKNSIVPQAFLDHYESNGWKVGPNKMSDWKASIRTWEQREKEKRSSTQSPGQKKPANMGNFEERTYTVEDMDGYYTDVTKLTKDDLQEVAT